MKIFLKKYILELQHPFTIARQSFTTKPTLIVTLSDNEVFGIGESSSNPYYNITVESMMVDINTVKKVIENTMNESPDAFWNKLFPLLKHNMFALSALDIAYNDLYAKKKKKKLYELWNLDITKNPLTNFTIGIDTIDKMVLKMKEMPFPLYKIKLGTKDDLKIIKALRKETDAVFRVDANCSWSVDETLKNSNELKALNVEFIEQPLQAGNWDGHKSVFKKSALPIIADESCLIESDIEKCSSYFHGVNIKLTKCGGLTPARRMISNAKRLGLKTMVGCMTESSVGVSAISHLLPLLDYVDMDGALLLKTDVATGVTINHGKVIYSSNNGIGATLKKDNKS